MVRVKTETSYTLQCQHCKNKTLKVEKLEREIQGWRIDGISSLVTVTQSVGAYKTALRF